MAQGLVDQALKYMSKASFDSLAVARIDFTNHSYSAFEITKKRLVSKKPYLSFDLASLTKPLTLAVTKLVRPEIFTAEMELLLNHKAGFISGGRLPRIGWKEELFALPIKASETKYSDYSALRLQIEIEKKLSFPLKNLVTPLYHSEVCYYKDLLASAVSPVSGERGWRELTKEVNDENASVIGEFTAHAGLFGTIRGVAETIISLDKNYSLNKKMEQAFAKGVSDRFIEGWDRVENPEVSTAGVNASLKTFGHLGFTGTSIWIDLEKKLGSVILSNATQNFNYAKSDINEIRKGLGALIFKL